MKTLTKKKLKCWVCGIGCTHEADYCHGCGKYICYKARHWESVSNSHAVRDHGPRERKRK